MSQQFHNQSSSRRGLTFSVIGASPVARIFAAGLAGTGHQLLGVHLLDGDDEDTVSALIPDVEFNTAEKLASASNLILLGTDDGALPELIQQLANQRVFQNGQLVIHFSAPYGTEVLLPAVEQGAIPFALHPAFEFTGTSLDLARMQESWCAITAPVQMLPIAQALVIELGSQPFIIDEEDRAQYAEAIFTARDFSAALVNQAKALLKDIGVDHPGAVLEQVFRSSLEKALDDIVHDTIDMYGVEPPQSEKRDGDGDDVW